MARQPKFVAVEPVENPAEHVPDPWRDQFELYLSTGEGTPDFFEFLDHDPAGQRAVEAALTQRASAFDHFTTELKRAFHAANDPMPMTQILGDLERVAALPREQRTVMADQIAVAVKNFDGTAERRIRDFFSQIGEKFTKL
jgi:hypothetical protein